MYNAGREPFKLTGGNSHNERGVKRHCGLATSLAPMPVEVRDTLTCMVWHNGNTTRSGVSFSDCHVASRQSGMYNR